MQAPEKKKTTTAGLLWNHPNHFVLVVSTRLKNMLVKLDHFPRGEHKTYVETTNLVYQLLIFLKALLNPYQTVGGGNRFLLIIPSDC